MARSVDGRETIETRDIPGGDGRMGEQRATAGWYPDPFDRSMQRYWSGDSWTISVRRLPPVIPLPPMVADEVWPPSIDSPKSAHLPAVIDTLDSTEDPANLTVEGRWYSKKRVIVPLLLAAALATVGVLTQLTGSPDVTDTSPADTIQTTAAPPITTNSPATTSQAPTTSQVTSTIAPSTTTTQAPTTTQAVTTTQFVASEIDPEEQFQSWVAAMTLAFEGGPPAQDDRVLTESNASFLCARARGNETYDSLVQFVRGFFYDDAPQEWDPQPEVLDNYSTAYVDSSLQVYCSDVYVELLER